MSENIFQKFRDKFFEEATMLLDKFEKDILELEKTPDDRELLESVFRAMHTIKGISAMYGFEFISDFTHVLENIFQNMRDGKIRFSKELSEIALVSIDHIHNLLNDEKLLNRELKSKHHNLLAEVSRIASFKTTEEPVKQVKMDKESEGPHSWLILIDTSEQMYFRGISLQGICRELSALGDYKIGSLPFLNTDSSDCWGIFLASSASPADIHDVFMFIEDECRILHITDTDLINSGIGREVNSSSLSQILNEPSLIDLIEGRKADYPGEDKALEISENDVEKQNNIKHQSRRIAVDTDKLDNLMYLVSQLITLNSQLNVSNRNGEYLKLRDQIEILDSLSKQFRTNALEIRLVPLSDISLRFQRLIRDLSKTMGKEIEYVTEGMDTELDKNTIDRIGEPLMHIMRNCVDHGIEAPAIRKELGKPEKGTIKLSASYSGNNIIIKVQDDGSGINLEKVRKKAIEKGILKKTDKPSEQELHDIIFLSGFSTSQNLSEVSGRGVGMDIVRKSINDLRGNIALESKTGQGTSFMIKLSQSIAITDTLLFEVQGNFFIVPVSDIVLCDQVDISKLEMRKHTSTIPFNNELIPYINLRKYLRLGGNYKENSKSIIVRNGEHNIAIIADRIIGEHQAVLKPLHKTYNSETIISSVSQLGDGNIAFLIDSGILKKHIAN